MPQGPRYERSPDQLDWVDEAQHYEDWLQEEAERDAMAAIEAEKGFAPEQASEPEHSDPAANETTGAPIFLIIMPSAFEFTQNRPTEVPVREASATSCRRSMFIKEYYI